MGEENQAEGPHWRLFSRTVIEGTRRRGDKGEDAARAARARHMLNIITYNS